jgi:hypothetical protein
MPLPSGRLLQYGIDSGLPLMFSANAFARYKDGEFRDFHLDTATAIPAHVDAALDSAGFTAASQARSCGMELAMLGGRLQSRRAEVATTAHEA